MRPNLRATSLRKHCLQAKTTYLSMYYMAIKTTQLREMMNKYMTRDDNKSLKARTIIYNKRTKSLTLCINLWLPACNHMFLSSLSLLK